jgi:uncharacterized delta-60 repeat protein
MTIAGTLAIVSFCCLAAIAVASRSALRLDPSFGAGGVARTGATQLDSGFERSALVADSRRRLLVLGASRSSFTVTRYLANGRLDRGFAGDGVAEVVVPGLTSPPVPEEGQSGAGEPEPTALALQPDGGILLVGSYHANFGPGPASVVARLQPNGQIDPTFGGPGSGGEAPGQVVPRDPGILTIAAQGRRILIAGGGGGAYVTRLNHDGSLDRSFGGDHSGRIDLPPPPAGQTRLGKGRIGSLVVLRKGGFYAGGYHKGRFFLARLGRNGTLDRSFGEEGWVETSLSRQGGCHCSFGRSLTRDRRGRLLLAGTVSSAIAGLGSAFGRLSEPSKIAIARYRPDGSLDRSFGNDGTVLTRVASAAYAHDIAVAPGGALFVAATSTGKDSPMGGAGERFTVLRYGADGRRQGLFAARFGGILATAWEALVDQAGRVVVGGTVAYGSPRRVTALIARFEG